MFYSVFIGVNLFSRPSYKYHPIRNQHHIFGNCLPARSRNVRYVTSVAYRQAANAAITWCNSSWFAKFADIYRYTLLN